MKRIEKLQKVIEQKRLDAFIVENPLDLFYLTGLKLSRGVLWVRKGSSCLFVDGRYIEAARAASPCPVSLFKVLGDIAQSISAPKVGFDASFTSYSGFKGLQSAFPSSELVPCDALVQGIRSIKEEGEIVSMRKAATLVQEGVREVVSSLREGISEQELAAQLEIFWLRRACAKVAFEPIIAFGENSAFPHHRPSSRTLMKEELVLIDVGVTIEGYASDITRVVYFGKNPPPLLQEIYGLVHRAQGEAFARIKAGVHVGEVEKASRDTIVKGGYGEFYPHGLGHGVGLEVHELPVLKEGRAYETTVLTKGMVFTIEPGIYLVGQGGVRLEDTVYLTDEGFEILTGGPPASSLLCEGQ